MLMRRELGWLASLGLAFALGSGCSAAEPVPPGLEDLEVAPSVVRRLGRHDYDNTMRDLLGTTLRPGTRFPADDHAHGFDNNAEAMSLSATQLELYVLATEQLVDQVRADPTLWARIVPCGPDLGGTEARACARASLEHLLPRAWRRPVAAEELDSLMVLFDRAQTAGDPFEESMAQVLRAVLLSPHLLFRVEHDPPGAGSGPVSDHELATRLSYFLWSSMPDGMLRAAADAGELHEPDVLERQTRRMLEDPRAEALVDDFAGQWLYIRALDDVFRDVSRFPHFDEELREAMVQEMRLSFRSFIEEDRDVRELLLSERTFATHRLAGHYGLATAPYEGVRELDLTDLPRSGWLTTPGLMTALSPPFRTSPPQRGRWVLSQLLCQPLQPPPAGVTTAAAPPGARTIRERLEAHQADPACASCHAAMDPIGLAFEHFDAVGAFRYHEGQVPIDASGQLPSGEALEDATELARIIAADPAFIDCVVRQTFTYALGRAPTPADEPHLAQIVERLAEADYGFAQLLVLIVRSVPFRHRRPSEPAVEPNP
ncbi:MAG: DUF1592 domain-containing protein [Nannocystaceae bacterium]